MSKPLFSEFPSLDIEGQRRAFSPYVYALCFAVLCKKGVTQSLTRMGVSNTKVDDKSLPDETNQKIYELRNQGVEWLPIAQKLGISEMQLAVMHQDWRKGNGIKNGSRSKNMTEEKKKGAYELLLKGYTVHEVASYYSYSDSNISLCVHKYCDENGLEFPKKTRPSFTDAQLKEIYELKKSGMSDKEIAKEYIVSRSMVEMNIKKYCKSKGLNVPVLRRGRGRRHDRTATI